MQKPNHLSHAQNWKFEQNWSSEKEQGYARSHKEGNSYRLIRGSPLVIPPTPKKQDQINPKQIQKNVTVVPPPSRGGNEEKIQKKSQILHLDRRGQKGRGYILRVRLKM